MKVLYIKNIKNNLKDEETMHISGDGDSAKFCRLCGANTNLKHFKHPYVWEGNEERYDDLLYDCFGIKVTSADSMICEYCVRDLRTMEKFKTLVCSAFQEETSAGDRTTLTSSSNKTLRTSSCQTNSDKRKLKKPLFDPIQPKRNQLLDSKNVVNKKWTRPQVNSRRINVQCQNCKQRYPMMTDGEIKPFTCARCKCMSNQNSNKKCKVKMPSCFYRVHLDLTRKTELRGKPRPRPSKSRLTKNFSPPKAEMKHNAKYLKTNTAFSKVTVALSKHHGRSRDKLFYIIPDDGKLTPSNTAVQKYERSLDMTFKNSQSLTQNVHTQ